MQALLAQEHERLQALGDGKRVGEEEEGEEGDPDYVMKGKLGGL